MVDLQHSCPNNLINATTICVTDEQEAGKEEISTHVNHVIAEISEALQRERQKNAELLERISILEAQIREKDEDHFHDFTYKQGLSPREMEDRSLKKFKRQRLELKRSDSGNENGNIKESDVVNMKNNVTHCLVNWMSMDETHSLHQENLNKDGDHSILKLGDDTDDSDNDYPEDLDNSDVKEHIEGTNEIEEHIEVNDSETNEDVANRYTSRPKKEPALKSESQNMPFEKKTPKMAFCPKEVKRIIESEALLDKNAQSHTIRKILVFAYLGISHGCEDIYELDFNHFSILKKGEPYVSPQNPGEHVLYDNPGVRRKIFYPNKQNPTLCPVQTLEEEKSMRPSDTSCPSHLFLCIKYGGRTRNSPQNEYVRQRMGRNKIKSFGPVMCRMAMLVNIRSGSFFFKALGITLLFMTGFSDDLVQKETKYRNLDLLHKYYRTDEDAKGEEPFHPYPMSCDIITSKEQFLSGSKQLSRKTTSRRGKGKKQVSDSSEHPSISNLRSFPSPSSLTHSVPFGMIGYTSVQPITSPLISCSCAGPTCQNQNPSSLLFPSQTINPPVPMMYWPPCTSFNSGIYPSTYGYNSPLLPPSGNYISVHPHPSYFNHPSRTPLSPFKHKALTETEQNEVAVASRVNDGESDSGSSNSKRIVAKEQVNPS